MTWPSHQEILLASNFFRNLFAHKQSLLLTTTITVTPWRPGRPLSLALHIRPLGINPKLMPAHFHPSGWEQLLFVSFFHVTLCLSNRKGLSVWPQLDKTGTVLHHWAPGKDQHKCWCSRQPKQRAAIHVRQGTPIILLNSCRKWPVARRCLHISAKLHISYAQCSQYIVICNAVLSWLLSLTLLAGWYPSWQLAQELVQPLLNSSQLLLWSPSQHSHWRWEVFLLPLCRWEAEIKAWLN